MGFLRGIDVEMDNLGLLLLLACYLVFFHTFVFMFFENSAGTAPGAI